MMAKMKEDVNIKLLREISKKLESLITLSAANLAYNRDLDNTQKAKVLSSAGFTSKEIGNLLGIRDDSVRRILSKIRIEKQG